jgi:hypothetical protein
MHIQASCGALLVIDVDADAALTGCDTSDSSVHPDTSSSGISSGAPTVGSSEHTSAVTDTVTVKYVVMVSATKCMSSDERRSSHFLETTGRARD